MRVKGQGPRYLPKHQGYSQPPRLGLVEFGVHISYFLVNGSSSGIQKKSISAPASSRANPNMSQLTRDGSEIYMLTPSNFKKASAVWTPNSKIIMHHSISSSLFQVMLQDLGKNVTNLEEKSKFLKIKSEQYIEQIKSLESSNNKLMNDWEEIKKQSDVEQLILNKKLTSVQQHLIDSLRELIESQRELIESQRKESAYKEEIYARKKHMKTLNFLILRQCFEKLEAHLPYQHLSRGKQLERYFHQERRDLLQEENFDKDIRQITKDIFEKVNLDIHKFAEDDDEFGVKEVSLTELQWDISEEDEESAVEDSDLASEIESDED